MEPGESEVGMMTDVVAKDVIDSVANSGLIVGSDPLEIRKGLEAWVRTVEEDSKTQVQEYLEQVDAKHSGE